MPDAKETSMLDNMQKETNGIWAGAAKNTSDIPPEKIPLGARETVRTTKMRKSKQKTHSGQ
jgi:hypothetical protein